jgi:hypothetical protein
MHEMLEEARKRKCVCVCVCVCVYVGGGKSCKTRERAED